MKKSLFLALALAIICIMPSCKKSCPNDPEVSNNPITFGDTKMLEEASSQNFIALKTPHYWVKALTMNSRSWPMTPTTASTMTTFSCAPLSFYLIKTATFFR